MDWKKPVEMEKPVEEECGRSPGDMMVAWTKKVAVKIETRGWVYFRDRLDKTCW